MKRITQFVLVCVVLLGMMPIAHAQQSAANPTVRVAFVQQKGLMEVDQDGQYSGYSYEYIMKIAQYAHWNVQLVFAESSDEDAQIMEMMDKLQKGEVDIMGSMLASPGLEAYGILQQNSYGDAFTTLLAFQGNASITPDNLVLHKDLRIAIMKQAKTRNGELDAYCTQQHMSYTAVMCDSEEDQLAAVRSGKADLMLSVSLLKQPGTKVVAKFAGRPFYFMCSKKRPELVEQMDAALHALSITEPNLRSNLHNQYFEQAAHELYFTEEERAYLDKKKTLRVLIPYELAPLQFMDSKHEYHGIFIAFSQYLSEKTGLDVEFTMQPGHASLDNIENIDEYDMILGVSMNYDYVANHSIICSEPLLKMDTTLFYNSKVSLDDLSKATMTQVDSAPAIKADGPIKTYASLEECIAAVESKKADYGYGSSLLVDYVLSERAYTNIMTIPVVDDERSFCVAFPQDTAESLITIVNRVIEGVDSSTMNTFISEASYPQNESIELFIRRNPVLTSLLLSGFLLFIVVLVMALYLSHRRRRENLLLVKANNAKSEFLSHMSHEMRTPLNAILGITMLAMDEVHNSEEMTDSLHKIEDSSRLLLNQINDVLDISKIEKAGIELHPEPYDMNRFVEQIRLLIEPLCRKKKLTFAVDTQQMQPVALRLDKVRFDQIFFNLLSNAVKYTPDGGHVFFKISTIPQTDGKMSVSLEVRDNGIGMHPEFQKNMFEPFEREQNSTTMRQEGTGLGLCIVKQLVDLMHGTIAVDSKLGEGTSFVVCMTAELCDKPAEEIAEGRTPPSTLTLQGKRVLLCEDQPLNAEISVRLLRKVGVTADVAVNGQEGVALFAQSASHYYDAILMDIRMPVKNGLIAAKEIRAMRRADAQSIPIIAMTANAFEEDKQQSKAAGMNAHLAKPIEPKLLYRVLQEQIGTEDTMP